MGKTRNLFKKIGNVKGNISCKDGHNKGQKCKDLTEAEEIKNTRIHRRTVQKRSS